MIAKKLNTPIRDYASHYITERDWSIHEKMILLLRKKISDIFFIYEADHFSYYWDIFLTR